MIEALVGIFIAIIGGAGLIVAFGLVYGLFNAYVLTVLWGWFAVPILGMKMLTVTQMWALMLIPAYFLAKRESLDFSKKMDTEQKVSALLTPFIAGGFFLLAGWILKHYI
jgi:proteasome assembly chaperone (PAC2) family protein